MENRNGMCALFHYEGGIAGEEPFDVCTQEEPLRVILGAHQVIPAIEEALYEMELGETRELTIAPEEGYGPHDPNGVQVYPRMMLPEQCASAEVGDWISWTNPASGMPIPVRVIEAAPEAVKLDFNHPFAGKTLFYRITLDQLVK